jgi:hypothetical protein
VQLGSADVAEDQVAGGSAVDPEVTWREQLATGDATVALEAAWWLGQRLKASDARSDALEIVDQALALEGGPAHWRTKLEELAFELQPTPVAEPPSTSP